MRAGGRVEAGEALEVRVPLDVRAPGAARIVVGECLRDRVAASVLESALLVVSELVTNSVRHGGDSAAGVMVVRVVLTETLVRVEAEDHGGRRRVIGCHQRIKLIWPYFRRVSKKCLTQHKQCHK